jgi:dipeptidyl aminopeptidase/acylaminoacyl peptidase
VPVNVWFHDTVDGSGDLSLASGVIAINPHWSPDGKRIAFAGVRSVTSRNWGLWLVSAAGGDAASYRSEIDFGYDAIWSKDGKRIYSPKEETGRRRSPPTKAASGFSISTQERLRQFLRVRACSPTLVAG